VGPVARSKRIASGRTSLKRMANLPSDDPASRSLGIGLGLGFFPAPAARYQLAGVGWSLALFFQPLPVAQSRRVRELTQLPEPGQAVRPWQVQGLLGILGGQASVWSVNGGRRFPGRAWADVQWAATPGFPASKSELVSTRLRPRSSLGPDYWLRHRLMATTEWQPAAHW